ncbi:MAG: sulfotransferase domain-containing protein [Actinomycetota bacterium]|nr:sulfotransferase domain-containing protein [Actinomycetota bacterium]
MTVRYRNMVYDTARWEGFRFRDDDIVISTPPKSGTTWTQMLCALLIFDSTTFDRPLARISPWLDMLTRPLEDVVAELDAQEHRRFIKTHSPLDGLPFDDRVTYLCVGRDPRDVALSWEHHWGNIDQDVFMERRADAVGLDDLAELGPPPPPPPEDPVERFWAWVDGDPITSSLSRTLQHLGTFWERRDAPNVALFHYADLSADLVGQLRRLAGVLGIERSDARLEELAAAATFDRMKERASDLAPNSDQGWWRSTEGFFHRGSSGQWRHLVDDAGLARYDATVAELVPSDLAEWAHHGWLGAPSVREGAAAG